MDKVHSMMAAMLVVEAVENDELGGQGRGFLMGGPLKNRSRQQLKLAHALTSMLEMPPYETFLSISLWPNIHIFINLSIYFDIYIYISRAWLLIETCISISITVSIYISIYIYRSWAIRIVDTVTLCIFVLPSKFDIYLYICITLSIDVYIWIRPSIYPVYILLPRLLVGPTSN
jgi:hypothetical protein